MTKYKRARGKIKRNVVIIRSIGDVVKELRIQRQMNITALADKAKIPYQSVQNIEKGTKPNFEYVERIAKALNVPLETFSIERRKVCEENSKTAAC